MAVESQDLFIVTPAHPEQGTAFSALHSLYVLGEKLSVCLLFFLEIVFSTHHLLSDMIGRDGKYHSCLHHVDKASVLHAFHRPFRWFLLLSLRQKGKRMKELGLSFLVILLRCS